MRPFWTPLALIDSSSAATIIDGLLWKDRVVSDEQVKPTEEVPTGDTESLGTYEKAPDGALRWPAPDRDSPQLGSFSGLYEPHDAMRALLQMEGRQGRSDTDVKAVTGVELKRSRRWHKIFERMGIFYPGEGHTRLGRLGRLLRDASRPGGMKLVIAREAVEVLRRYQFDNPVERSLPEGCNVHPYYAVLKAASKLEWRIHWDEVNRELMRLMKDSDLDPVIDKIRAARSDPAYAAFIGATENDPGQLSARTHPAEATAPSGKTPEGQLRDQRMTPFLKRVGFGELLLESPGSGGGGYWTVPTEVRDIVSAAVSAQPPAKRFATEQEWIEWFCEGTAAAAAAVPPPPPPAVALPIASLTLAALRTALATYEPDLTFSDQLLASVIAALRSGDGKNFIILRGVSGTGKSRLVSSVAKAVYGSAKVDRPHLTIVEVRPDWTDGSPLLGHYDPIGRRYIREPFLDTLIAANNSEAPVFVCLDEMNLARVEYYLAECLSAMESGNEITLDTRDDDNIPARIVWPKNLYLFGTVNVDESTLKISDKVLDRAQVIDTSEIDLLPVLKTWVDGAGGLDAAEKKRVSDVLGGVWTVLKSIDAHFGFRAARAAVRFIAEVKASSDGVVSIDSALDAQLCQKILVKLRGEGERWAKPLEELEKLCTGLGHEENSREIVTRMRQDLERLGSFQFWN